MDNVAIKDDFGEHYRLMNGKLLQEVDEIIYAVCSVCEITKRRVLFGG